MHQNQQKPMSYEEFRRWQYDQYMAQFRQHDPDNSIHPDNSYHRNYTNHADSFEPLPRQSSQSPQGPDHVKPESPAGPEAAASAAVSTKKPDLFIFYLLGFFGLLWLFSKI